MSKPELNVKEQLFMEMVNRGFEPVRMFIEKKRIEEDLTPADIHKVMEEVEQNLCTWIEWMKHQKKHMPGGYRD